MKKTKVLALILAIAMIICALPLNALAASDTEVYTSGVAGTFVEWRLDGSTLKIVRTGDIKQTGTVFSTIFMKNRETRENLVENVTSLEIGTGIYDVKFVDFSIFEKLVDVKMAATVGCTDADKVEHSIDVETFKTMDALETISLATDKTIATNYKTVNNCLLLKGVLMIAAGNCDINTKEITSIEANGAFVNPKAVKKLTVYKDLAEDKIETGSFAALKYLTELTVPKFFDLYRLFNVGYGTEDAPTYLYETEAVVTVLSDQFAKYSVDLEDLGYNCVFGLVLPSDMKEFNGNDLGKKLNMRALSIADGNDLYASNGNCIVLTKKWNTIKAGTLIAATSNCTIPAEVKYIYKHAFYNCDDKYIAKQTTLTIPEGVEEIDALAFDNGENAANFYAIKLPASLTSVTGFTYSASKVLFANALKVYYPGTKEDAKKILVNGNHNFILSDTNISNWVFNALYADCNVDAWYYPAVKSLNEKGVMTGYENGNFGPADAVNREHFILALARADAYKKGYTTKGKVTDADLERFLRKYDASILPFTDVTGLDDINKKAIAWAYVEKITTGKSKTTFGLGAIAREELVTFVVRFANVAQIGFEYPSMDEATHVIVASRLAYKDMNKVSSWAQESVVIALANSVINGRDGKLIAPQATTLRCEVAKILNNLINIRIPE